MIEHGLRTEEAAIPLYYKNYVSALSWVVFDEDTRRHIRRTLEQMGRESQEHRRLLEDARDRILKETRHVY